MVLAVRPIIFALGGIVVSVIASEPKVFEFKPDQGQWGFKRDKKSSARLPSEWK
jgi:hypothetical protein